MESLLSHAVDALMALTSTVRSGPEKNRSASNNNASSALGLNTPNEKKGAIFTTPATPASKHPLENVVSSTSSVPSEKKSGSAANPFCASHASQLSHAMDESISKVTPDEPISSSQIIIDSKSDEGDDGSKVDISLGGGISRSISDYDHMQAAEALEMLGSSTVETSSIDDNISEPQCEQRVPISYVTSNNSSTAERNEKKERNKWIRWSEEEDERLRIAVEEVGENKFGMISEKYFDGMRSKLQCRNRWKMAVKPGLQKGHWTKEEDELIKKRVEAGEKKWAEIAKKMEGRTGEQIKERWITALDPTVVRGVWSDAEMNALILAQKEMGNKWSDIAKRIPGRSEKDVKNRWYNQKTSERRAEKRAKNGLGSQGSTTKIIGIMDISNKRPKKPKIESPQEEPSQKETQKKESQKKGTSQKKVQDKNAPLNESLKEKSTEKQEPVTPEGTNGSAGSSRPKRSRTPTYKMQELQDGFHQLITAPKKKVKLEPPDETEKENTESSAIRNVESTLHWTVVVIQKKDDKKERKKEEKKEPTFQPRQEQDLDSDQCCDQQPATIEEGRKDEKKDTNVVSKRKQKQGWKEEEDEKLKGLVTSAIEKSQSISWIEVSEHMDGRTGKQCRERWLYHLTPNLKKGRWTEEEDRMICEWQQKIGNKWSRIAEQIPKRTDNDVKNRWYSLMRSQKRRKSNEFSLNKTKRKVSEVDEPEDVAEGLHEV